MAYKNENESANVAGNIVSISVSWQVDHEQYWQGHGIAFTDYTHCATGSGESLRDAFEDALEGLAEQDVRLTDAQEKELLADLKAQVSTDVKEPLDMTIVDGYCDAGGEHMVECDECDGTGKIDANKDNEDIDNVIMIQCGDCEGTGKNTNEDPDCAVCSGECHFYVSIDARIEEVSK